METYQTRKIAFRELLPIHDWQVKSYTITKHASFRAETTYQAVLQQLPQWLKMENSFNAKHQKIAFLIVHEGTEGVFVLVNWWVGDNMLNSLIFMAKHEHPEVFEQISGDGLMACVWELEVINHERISWLNHVLKPSPQSQFENYLQDTITLEL
ncbi:MAG TPA: hypothetical protein DCS93_41315 [Microscillaceae bacterium]|nr:hypothetical protein [Microscillaceae bacterium]